MHCKLVLLTYFLIQVHENERNLRTSVCTDNSGNIYIASSKKKKVTMINDDLDDLEVAQTTGTVHCMAWCSTSNCLWVVHYNADGTRMLASRHDVHARAEETRGEQAEPELYYQGYQLD